MTTGAPFTGGSSDHVKSLTVEKELIVNGKLRLARDWTPYVPTFSSTGAAPSLGSFQPGSRFVYRIVGNTLEVRLSYFAAGSVTGTGTYTISIPTGCLIRSSTFAPDGLLSGITGMCWFAGVSLHYYGFVTAFSQTSIQCDLIDTANASGVRAIQWGAGANAEIRAGVAHAGSIMASFELDPASPILAASSQ